jgi:hypothetical protein
LDNKSCVECHDFPQLKNLYDALAFGLLPVSQRKSENNAQNELLSLKLTEALFIY